MKVINKILNLKTRCYLEFIDITDKVEKLLKLAHIKDGIICIYSRHTTLAIRINEKESGFFQDFKDFCKKLLPENIYYRHNDLSIRTENIVCSPGATDCLNGHSHCQHLLLGTSESVPVVAGKMLLGTYQRIFAVELDDHRQRQVVIQVIGK